MTELCEIERKLTSLYGQLGLDLPTRDFLSLLNRYFSECFKELTDDCGTLTIKSKNVYALTLCENIGLLYLPKKYGMWKILQREDTELLKEVFDSLLEINCTEN